MDDSHWVLVMMAAKRYTLIQGWAKARQGAGAKQHVKKTSRNLLDNVGESLHRWLQVDKPSAKRRLAQSTNVDK